MKVAGNARLLIENLFDLTHFYPLHADNIGSLADAMVPVEIERGDGGAPTEDDAAPLVASRCRR